MAEVIGLISALYTIGKAGLSLYDTLTLFAEGIKTAARDVSLVTYEIKSTSEILLLIRDSLEESKDSRSDIVKQGRLILEGLATQCEFCHDLIQELISYLKPYFDESKCSASRDLVRLGQRPKPVKLLDKWRWQQQRPKVDKLRGYLEGLKSNLGLVLPILHYEIAAAKRAPPITLQSLKDTIDTALREATLQPRKLAQELAQEAATARSTSMAVIVQNNRMGTPQDVIQDLAADILFTHRQYRPYVHHDSELDAPYISRERPKQAYQTVDQNIRKDGSITSTSEDSEVYDTISRTRSRQSPLRALHQEVSAEKYEGSVGASRGSMMNPPTVNSATRYQIVDEAEEFCPDHQSILVDPSMRYREPPIAQFARHHHEEAGAFLDDERNTWGNKSDLSKVRADGRGGCATPDSIASCPKASFLNDTDIKVWRTGVYIDRPGHVEPTIQRMGSSHASHGDDLAGRRPAEVHSTENRIVEDIPAFHAFTIRPKSNVQRNHSQNQPTLPRESVFEKETNRESPSFLPDSNRRSKMQSNATKRNARLSLPIGATLQDDSAPTGIPRTPSKIRKLLKRFSQ